MVSVLLYNLCAFGLVWFGFLAVPLASLLIANVENVMFLLIVIEALEDFIN